MKEFYEEVNTAVRQADPEGKPAWNVLWEALLQFDEDQGYALSKAAGLESAGWVTQQYYVFRSRDAPTF